MKRTDKVSAALFGVAVFAAAPAAALNTIDIIGADGAQLTCDFCQGIVGTQNPDGSVATVTPPYFDPAAPVAPGGGDQAGSATLFTLPSSGVGTEFAFLVDLIAASPTISVDPLDPIAEPSDNIDFAGSFEEGSFSVGAGFFLLKVGGGGGPAGGSDMAFFYTPFAAEVEYSLNGASGVGASHYAEFGGTTNGSGLVEGEVPLPAALPLMGAGLAALGLVARRRRRAG